MKLFFSFKFGEHDTFIQSLAIQIKSLDSTDEPIFDVYFDLNDRRAGQFQERLEGEINQSASLVFFIGQSIGPTQLTELTYAIKNDKIILPIYLPTYRPPGSLPPEINEVLRGWAALYIEDTESDLASASYAQQIRTMLRYGLDGLPHGYPFSYEKEIIATYLREGGLSEEMLLAGCPRIWPDVERNPASEKNPVPPSKVGDFRDCGGDGDDSPPGREPRVLSMALTDAHSLGISPHTLSFPEAGPRKWIAFSNKQRLNVGVLVSGGIAPGVNAVLAGLMKRQVLYADYGGWACRILLYREGFKALTSHTGQDRIFRDYYTGGQNKKRQELDDDLAELDALADAGGSYLPTARSDILLPTRPDVRDEKLEAAVRTLKTDGIDVL